MGRSGIGMSHSPNEIRKRKREPRAYRERNKTALDTQTNTTTGRTLKLIENRQRMFGVEGEVGRCFGREGKGKKESRAELKGER